MPRTVAREVPRWKQRGKKNNLPGFTPADRQFAAAVAREVAKAQAVAAREPGEGREGTRAGSRGTAARNDVLARTGAWRFRRHLRPFAALAALLIAGAVLHGVPLRWLWAGLASLLVPAVMSGAARLKDRDGKRLVSDWARRYTDLEGLWAGLWLPFLSVRGDRACIVALLLTWLPFAGMWVRRYRWQPKPPEKAAASPTGDLATWEKLAAKRRWTGHLVHPEEVPGGRKWEIDLDGTETHIGQVLAEPRAIAAAWGKPMTEAYAEPHPTGVESRGVLTVLRGGTLEQVDDWNGVGFDSDGVASIGRFADSQPAKIRILVPMDGTKHGLVAGTSGAGKALALDTPIPTPSGWTTMGKLEAGDLIYDESGSPCRVTHAWPVRHDRPCYEVRFSDGSTVVADAEHLWLAETQRSRMSESNARRTPGGGTRPRRMLETSKPVVVNTEEMLSTLRTPSGHLNYSVRIAAPLRGDEANLPVPPYTLGAWLGDGNSASGAITSADSEIVTEIEQEMRTHWGKSRPSIEEVGAWPSRVTVSAAARALGISKPTAYTLAKRGQFPAAVIQPDRSKCPSGHPYDSANASGTPVCRECDRAATRRSYARWAGKEDAEAVRPQPSRVMVDTASLIEALRREQFVTTIPSGEREGCAHYWIRGLNPLLREAGVLGSKRIPVTYLRASEDQRRALLAGLLDTDGHCTKDGRAEFCNTNERLARDVLHLVSTLGYKATIRSKTARLNGRDCGTAWTVSFTPGDKVFRLTRKVARQVTETRPTASHRYVTDIRPIPSVPVRCITVDSPNRLYLVGETCIPTHNTEFLNLLIWLALTSPLPIVPVILDPQNGQSLPMWRDKVIYAAGIDECARMVDGLHAGMMDRSRRLASMTWEDDGHKVKGMEFFDTRVSGLPIVMVIMDEAPLLLSGDGNAKLAQRIQRKESESAKLARKTGKSKWVVAQVPSLGELGDQAYRAMLRGGNVVCLRTGERVSAGMLGLTVDPSALPQYFPSGAPTQGLGYVVSVDGRQAPFRSDLVPRAMRHQAVEVPQLEDEFLEAMAPAFVASPTATVAPLASAKTAPTATVPPRPAPESEPADDAPEGRRCIDAVWVVLSSRAQDMTRGEVIKWTGDLAETWDRKKWTVKAIQTALSALTDGTDAKHQAEGHQVVREATGVYRAVTVQSPANDTN